jgi:hypothetical protein
MIIENENVAGYSYERLESSKGVGEARGLVVGGTERSAHVLEGG